MEFGAGIRARSLGIAKDGSPDEDRPPAKKPTPKETLRLLGRDIPVYRGGKGDLVADDGKGSGSAASAMAYVAFRRDIPAGAQGWGVKGKLKLETIRGGADQIRPRS